MQWRMATGEDFDRLNNMTAYSRLQDLVGAASGAHNFNSAGEPIPQCAINRAIDSASHFIMEVW